MPATNQRPRFGARDLVYAVLDETTDIVGGTPTYGSVKALAGLGKIGINPNDSQATLYGDDQLQHIASTIGKIEVMFDLADILPSAYAEILGHTYASGQILENVVDQPPYIAVGFKLTRTGAPTYEYVWLFKGKLAKPEFSEETKKETINFQSQSFKGIFQPLASSGNWRNRLRTDDTSAPSATISGFFSSVVLTTGADLTAFTLVSGTGSTSAKTVTLTFAKASATNAANGSAQNIQVIKDSDKSIQVPTSYTPGSAGTSPTLVLAFTSIAATAYTVVVNAGLQDTNGVSVTPKSIAVTVS